jgi:hypothetical protein
MTITLEMFKVLCMFDQITSRFLNIIFDFGRKTKSFDGDFMACYHQFFVDDQAKNKTLAEKSDEAHSQSDDRKSQADSYDQFIHISSFEFDFFAHYLQEFVIM